MGPVTPPLSANLFPSLPDPSYSSSEEGPHFTETGPWEGHPLLPQWPGTGPSPWWLDVEVTEPSTLACGGARTLGSPGAHPAPEDTVLVLRPLPSGPAHPRLPAETLEFTYPRPPGTKGPTGHSCHSCPCPHSSSRVPPVSPCAPCPLHPRAGGSVTAQRGRGQRAGLEKAFLQRLVGQDVGFRNDGQT